MPKYLFEVSGVVEVEAPNVAQATRYVNLEESMGRLKHETARISAGSMTHAKIPRGKNYDYSEYRLSARSDKSSKKIKFLGRK